MHQKWKLYEIGLCRIKIQPSFDVVVYFNSHLHQRHLKIYIYILYHMPFGVELVRHIIIPGALSRWVIKGKINHVGPVVLVCMCAFAFRLPSYFVNGQFIWMVNSPKVLILCTYNTYPIFGWTVPSYRLSLVVRTLTLNFTIIFYGRLQVIKQFEPFASSYIIKLLENHKRNS